MDDTMPCQGASPAESAVPARLDASPRSTSSSPLPETMAPFSAEVRLLPKLDDWERWRDDRAEASTTSTELPADAPLIQRSLADPAVAPLRRRRSRFGMWVTVTVLAYVGTVVVLAMILS